MKSRIEHVVMKDYSSDMPYIEARKKNGMVVTEITTISDSDTGWSFGYYRKILKVQGSRIFLKTVRVLDIAYRAYTVKGKKAKRWIGNPDALELNDLKRVLMHFKCDWAINMINDMPYMWYFIKKKSVLHKVVDGSITSYEDLYKHLAKTVYKVKLSVSSMKIFCKHMQNMLQFQVTVYDVMDFTTNPDMFFQRIKKIIDDNHGLSNTEKEILLYDTLMTSANLGRKLNPMWSDKRLEEEHINQIIELNSKELGEKADNPIYKSLDEVNTSNVKILNTEREIFEQACRYSNCIYTNYYRQIINGTYIAAIVTLNGEEAMLGMMKYNNCINFNQCFRKHNKATSSLMLDFARKYTVCYNEELKKLSINSDISSTPINTPYTQQGMLPW